MKAIETIFGPSVPKFSDPKLSAGFLFGLYKLVLKGYLRQILFRFEKVPIYFRQNSGLLSHVVGKLRG